MEDQGIVFHLYDFLLGTKLLCVVLLNALDHSTCASLCPLELLCMSSSEKKGTADSEVGVITKYVFSKTYFCPVVKIFEDTLEKHME